MSLGDIVSGKSILESVAGGACYGLLTGLCGWACRNRSATRFSLVAFVVAAGLAVVGFAFDFHALAFPSLVFAGGFLTVLLLLWVFGLWGQPLTAFRNVRNAIALARMTSSAPDGSRLEIGGLEEIVDICRTRKTNADVLPLLRLRQTPEALRELLSLYETLDSIPPAVQPLFAYIANESAQHLKGERSPTTGEDISIHEYVRLLESSIGHASVEDVTFLDTITPTKWGDPNAKADPLARLAWDYFAVQEKRKKDTHKPPVRMRRLMLMEHTDWAADPRASTFRQKHADAKIDLWLLPPSSLRGDHQRLAGDMAVFFGSDGAAWIVWSDLDDQKLAVNIFHAGIICEQGIMHTRYSDFLRDALKSYLGASANDPFKLTDDSSNRPPDDFLSQHGIL